MGRVYSGLCGGNRMPPHHAGRVGGRSLFRVGWGRGVILHHAGRVGGNSPFRIGRGGNRRRVHHGGRVGGRSLLRVGWGRGMRLHHAGRVGGKSPFRVGRGGTRRRVQRGVRVRVRVRAGGLCRRSRLRGRKKTCGRQQTSARHAEWRESSVSRRGGGRKSSPTAADQRPSRCVARE